MFDIPHITKLQVFRVLTDPTVAGIIYRFSTEAILQTGVQYTGEQLAHDPFCSFTCVKNILATT